VNSHFGNWNPNGLPNLQKTIAKGQNLLDWRVIYIIENLLGHRCLKWARMTHLGNKKHKLWPKEGIGVKFPIWLRITKSQESPWFPYVQVACHIQLEIFWPRIQFFFRPHFNQRFTNKVMGLQSNGSPNLGNFGTPIWESRNKMTFRWWSCGQAQRII